MFPVQTEPDRGLGLDGIIVVNAVQAVLAHQLVVVEVSDYVQLCLDLSKQWAITRQQLQRKKRWTCNAGCAWFCALIEFHQVLMSFLKSNLLDFDLFI